MLSLKQTSDETLAALRIREWIRDRTRLRFGSATRYRRSGWCERRARDADAALVRVLDFEAAFALLTAEQQELLALVYGEGHTRAEAAAIIRRGARAIGYKVSQARRTLAAILDRRGIL